MVDRSRRRTRINLCRLVLYNLDDRIRGPCRIHQPIIAKFSPRSTQRLIKWLRRHYRFCYYLLKWTCQRNWIRSAHLFAWDFPASRLYCTSRIRCFGWDFGRHLWFERRMWPDLVCLPRAWLGEHRKSIPTSLYRSKLNMYPQSLQPYHQRCLQSSHHHSISAWTMLGSSGIAAMDAEWYRRCLLSQFGGPLYGLPMKELVREELDSFQRLSSYCFYNFIISNFKI